MEDDDDDEFGDLYTDVLQSFPSTSKPSPSSSFAAPRQPQKPPVPIQYARGSIDLNLQLDGGAAAGGSNLGGAQTLEPDAAGSGGAGLEVNLSGAAADSGRELDVQEDRIGIGSDARELEKTREASGGGGGAGNFDEESFRFDLEEEAQDGDGDAGPEPVIPGLSTGLGSGDGFDDLGREEPGGDDWDSDDSEDDLQIVLNDTNHGPMALEMGGELDDGQENGLGVDGDGMGFQHPGLEEQEWGEDGAQAADGEKKEGGEAAKLNAGIAMAPKPGYVGHGYHPFHSQFKYVRPGAAPLQGAPAAGPVGPPSQVRPPVNIAPTAGRGRGDWRPPGMKNVPGVQKGYGGPGWGNNAGGRGFGIGLDFTLPSHKTIFEVDIDGFEEKPWNNPGVEVTDFFNFGLTEESWKGYCKQLEQSRVESTMQSRIRVYESGRSEQEYDPDMPPELAAATGVNENAAENVNFRNTNSNHIEVGKSSAPARPPMPTGRPIQVETGSGERLPSIDTRPPRVRDSDAIIEIVCESFIEGQSSEDGASQPSEHDDPSKANHPEHHEIEDVPVESKSTEVRSSEKTRLPSPVKVRHHSEQSDSRGPTPVHSSGSENRLSRRLEDETPHSMSQVDNLPEDPRGGESSERTDGNAHESVSSDKAQEDLKLNADHVTKDNDDGLPLAVESVGMEEEVQDDQALTGRNQDEVPRSKRRKVGSHVNLSSGEENGEDHKAARSGSKSRPGNSKEYQKPRDVGEEVQGAHDAVMRNSRRHSGDDERNVQRRNRVGRHDTERTRDVVKGKDEHRDGGLARPPYTKYESSDKRKERDSSEGVWQRRDEDPHSRRTRTNDYRKQDPRLLERVDGMGSKYSGKTLDGDRIVKDDHLYSRKQIDNGDWRGQYEKDVVLRQRERDESLKTRHENVDDSRRRKNEENIRRDYSEKDDILLNSRESPSMRKWDREDLSDQRRRDDQTRTRESINDHHSMRQIDEVWKEREKSERANERDDRHRAKQYREGSMTNRERDEVREPVRSARVTDDKWSSHAKEKDEFNDAARYAEPKKRDRADDVHFSQHRGHEDRYSLGNPSSNHDSKSRKDRPSSHTDHNGSSHHKISDEKLKESANNKEHDARSQNSVNISKRAKDDHRSHRSEKADSEHSSGRHTQGHPNLTKKHREEASADDEEASKKGRSKLERWTSHKERDFSATTKSAASLKLKESTRGSINAESSVAGEAADKPTKTTEAVEPKPSAGEKAPQGVNYKKDNTKDLELKNNEPPAQQTADQHLDTVAKLKKRSERFKLPMPSEKDATNKKTDTESLLPSQTETPQAEPEVKSERPPRKRRWISG
uniref:Pre-mRNA polyadenylation factor Fip1 domain-containing protein n=1 Tax=Kalanchoe fedtschenkoi TaxID=63787 RepID=A0A7N0TBE9_KALFE